VTKRKQGEKDIEQLAAAARTQREQKCNEALNKLLNDHGCQLSAVVMGGNGSMIPINQVLALPVSILVSSK